jgi:hypothetical protein
MKTAELTGAALDWAVAKCVDDGLANFTAAGWRYYPSANWAQGGPIIEQRKIDVFWQSHQHAWVGSMSRGSNKIGFRHLRYGNTPLIAAMRCYVASKLGDTIDLPEELK